MGNTEPASAGPEPQRSQHGGEAGTEMFLSQLRIIFALLLTTCYGGDVAETPSGLWDMCPIPWKEKSIPSSLASRGKKMRVMVKGAEEEHSVSV